MINEFRPMNHLTSLQNFICTIGNLPTSYALSLSYEEQIWWLCDFLEKKVFPAIEENTNITEETQQAFVELQQFVTDYFNNLDVQEEINNKLDEMVEDGTLKDIIINNYLSIKKTYNTYIDAIEEISSFENIENYDGMKFNTLGYRNINDGGNANYYLLDNENDIPNNSYYETLSNGLYIVLIAENKINIKKLGAYCDGVHNDSSIFNTAIQYFNTLILPKSDVLLNNIIDVNKNNITLIGDNTNLIFNNSHINYDNLLHYSNLIIKNINFKTTNGTDYFIKAYGLKNVKIFNCSFENANFSSIYSGEGFVNDTWKIENCYFNNSPFQISLRPFKDIFINNNIFENINEKDVEQPPHFIYLRSDTNIRFIEDYDHKIIGDNIVATGNNVNINNNYFNGYIEGTQVQAFAIKISCTANVVEYYTNKNINISNNKILNTECAIFIFSSENMVISNNEIISTPERSLANNILRFDYCKIIKIINNSINFSTTPDASVYRCILVNSCFNVFIKNNKLYQKGNKMIASTNTFNVNNLDEIQFISNYIEHKKINNTDCVIELLSNLWNICQNIFFNEARCLVISSNTSENCKILNNIFNAQDGTESTNYGVFYGSDSPELIQYNNTMIGYLSEARAGNKNNDIYIN